MTTVELPEPEFLTMTTEKILVGISHKYDHETRIEIPALWGKFFSLPWAIDASKGQDTYGVGYDTEVFLCCRS